MKKIIHFLFIASALLISQSIFSMEKRIEERELKENDEEITSLMMAQKKGNAKVVELLEKYSKDTTNSI